MDPAFEAVVEAGIPLVIYNAGGIEGADRLGAMNYVGAVDYKAGVAGGAYLGSNGGKNGVCINSLPGAANIEDYCNGFVEGIESTGGTGSVLPLPATAQGNVTAVAQAGKEGAVSLCGINFDEAILTNINDGKQACAIDQQDYQQGYYAVSILNGYVNYGLSIPTREIVTGPGIVDASNIESTMSGASQGTR